LGINYTKTGLFFPPMFGTDPANRFFLRPIPKGLAGLHFLCCTIAGNTNVLFAIWANRWVTYATGNRSSIYTVRHKKHGINQQFSALFAF
jgi:hypothetical protein